MTKSNPSLLAYPQFPDPLTEKVIRELFTPTPDELRWVWHTSSVTEARLGLLCLLKSFPLLGRFPVPASIPASIANFLAQHAGLEVSTLAEYPKRTRLRHQVAIRRYLGVHAWSAAAAALATETMQRIVGGRAHFSDLLNGAIETLIGAHYELPALSTLRRLAGHVHATATNAWLTQVDERLTDSMRTGLEKLLAVPEGATESAFAQLCRPTKRASRDHLDEAIEQLNWLIELALPQDILAGVPVTRIEAWAEEARRLTATELREYIAPRRHALLICLLAQTRASRLDDLVTMLIRFLGRIEAKPRRPGKGHDCQPTRRKCGHLANRCRPDAGHSTAQERRLSVPTQRCEAPEPVPDPASTAVW